MTVDVPGEVEVLNCEHVMLLELPIYLGAPGFLMVIFGALNAALIHLKPASQTASDSYQLLGIVSLVKQDL